MGSHPPSLLVVLSVSLVVRRLFGNFVSFPPVAQPLSRPEAAILSSTEDRDRNIEVEESEDDIGDVDCEPDPIDRPSGGEPQERQREPRGVTEDGYPRALLHSSDGEKRKLTVRCASTEKGKKEYTKEIEPSPYPL